MKPLDWLLTVALVAAVGGLAVLVASVFVLIEILSGAAALISILTTHESILL